MKTIPWYFDIISPFAYLQLHRLQQFEGIAAIEPVPVLLAGLLQHWGSKGPAEIPPKRRFTYRHATWLGREHGIPLRVPPVHPFNPLPALRLLTGLEADLDTARSAFAFIWQEGRGLSSEREVMDFAAHLGLSPEQAQQLLADPAVKLRLREATDAAAARGVFGVPTLLIDDEVYWGFDATGMALQALRDPAGLNDAEMQRVGDLPVGVQRREAGA